MLYAFLDRRSLCSKNLQNGFQLVGPGFENRQNWHGLFKPSVWRHFAFSVSRNEKAEKVTDRPKNNMQAMKL